MHRPPRRIAPPLLCTALLACVSWLSASALQVAADAALYRAKRQGRNCVETYDASGNHTTRARAILQGTGEAG